MGFWNSARRVVEELGSGDDMALVSGNNRRFASDPLRFTGIDLGGGGSRPRSGYGYPPSDDATEDDSSEEETEEDDEEDEDDDEEISLTPEEEALVEAALKKIRKAQTKGRSDVKLNKEQLAALERRRSVMQAQAAAAERKQRRTKAKKFTVPLSHFDTAPPRLGAGGSSRHLEAPPGPAPPKGRFPPPTSAGRPQSYASSPGSSPFQYQYVQAPPNQRHASDPSNRSVSSREMAAPRNVFQYQTAGPGAPYPHGAASASDRDLAYGYLPPTTRRGAAAAAAAAARGSGPRALTANADETSDEEDDEEDESTSDEAGNGVQISRRNRSREEVVVVEDASPSPDPDPPSRSSRKKGATTTSSAASIREPTKRKPAASSSGKKRRGK